MGMDAMADGFVEHAWVDRDWRDWQEVRFFGFLVFGGGFSAGGLFLGRRFASHGFWRRRIQRRRKRYALALLATVAVGRFWWRQL